MMLKKIENIPYVIWGMAKALFFYFPFFILFLNAYHFTVGAISLSYSNVQYQILFGAIGLTATLSGLSLRVASITQDNKKKEMFYHCGKRLFHAVLLFIIAIVIKFSILQGNIGLLKLFTKNVLTLVAVSLELLYFYLGSLISAWAYFSLNKYLFEKDEKPLSHYI